VTSFWSSIWRPVKRGKFKIKWCVEKEDEPVSAQAHRLKLLAEGENVAAANTLLAFGRYCFKFAEPRIWLSWLKPQWLNMLLLQAFGSDTVDWPGHGRNQLLASSCPFH
jgi:hypothetical protein